MNNAEAKKIVAFDLESTTKWEKTVRSLRPPLGNDKLLEITIRRKETLQHCLTILDKLEQKGPVLPEEKDIRRRLNDYDLNTDFDLYQKMGISVYQLQANIATAIHQQVALNLVRFEEKLEKIIIDSDLYQTFISQNVDYSSVEKKLSQAISAELRGNG